MTAAAPVPAFDLTRQLAAIGPELAAAAGRVLASGRYVLGAEVEAFEREAAAYLGAGHAVGVASGTDALLLALRALGIGPGDQVLTSPFTFFATASAIAGAGAEPVFADVDPKTLQLDAGQVRQVLEAGQRGRPGRVRALVPVHLYGQPAEMGPLRAIAAEHGLAVVEDACQAMGAEYRGGKAGTLGDLACFSFFPTKNLGGAGDGGLVATADPGLAERVGLLRAHGARSRYLHEVIGTNSRLDALQAALLRVKLPHLDAWLTARRALAARYDEALAGLPVLATPAVAPGGTPTFHQYTVRVADGRRDGLRRHLAGQGVASTVYYPRCLHLQPALAHLGYREGDFPHAELASAEVLSLPMFPELRLDEVERVAAAVRAFLGS